MRLKTLALLGAFFVSGCSETAGTSASHISQPPPSAATCATMTTYDKVMKGCQVSAEEKRAEARRQIDDVCKIIGLAAEKTMEGRQSGVPLSMIIGPSTTPLMRTIALEAYNAPAFYSDAGKLKAMRDFRNDKEVSCQNQFVGIGEK